MAKGGLPGPYYLQNLHARMGENYARQGQRVKAIESWKKAIAVQGMAPRPDLESRLITEIYHTNPKPADLEPLVTAYLKKYPERDDRHQARTLLAIVYINNKEPAKAETILTEVLPFDCSSHNAVGYYLGLAGNDKAKLALVEQNIVAAIPKSKPYNTTQLRFSLALELHRDRTKEIAKPRTVAREAVFKFPTNEGHSGTMLTWLLDSAASDAEFQGDVAAYLAAYLAARKEVPTGGTIAWSWPARGPPAPPSTTCRRSRRSSRPAANWSTC